MTARERVQVFLTATGVPRILSGWLTGVEENRYTVEFEESDVLIEGQVVLNFPDSERERVMTRLDSMQGQVYRFQESHRVAPDKRNYPRLYAGLKVKYRSQADAGDWYLTDEYMNFSVSGLAFEGTGLVENGALLDVNIAVADGDKNWDAVGRVIRCDALEEAEHQELTSGDVLAFSLAVAFVSVPADCREALEALTLRLLDV
jgi:hypothetical protein